MVVTTLFAPGNITSVPVVSVAIVANGPTRPPIGMCPDPDIEARHSGAIANDPDITRAQIIRHAADISDVLDAIPDVGVRNPYGYHGRRRDYDWRRGCNRHNWWPHVYSPWLHNAAGY